MIAFLGTEQVSRQARLLLGSQLFIMRVVANLVNSVQKNTIKGK